MLTHFEGNLGFIVETGHTIVVAGRTIDGASTIVIRLASSRVNGSCIPLRLLVKFHEDIIVRNSFIDGVGWGTDEIEENIFDESTTNPIVSGEAFKIYIFVGDTKFHISVNGFPFCTYAFRTQLDEIRTVLVSEDVQAITQIDHRQAFPIPHPCVQFDNTYFTFSNDVPTAFTEGHVMVLTGIPYGSKKGQFLIIFTEQENTQKQALHFNPRFEQQVVVRTDAFPNGTFGPEERAGGFPFRLEQQFKLAIAFSDIGFLFAVNGRYFTKFNYRSSNVLSRLNGLKCLGRLGLNLEITGVDHLNMGNPSCDGFEQYCDPDVPLY